MSSATAAAFTLCEIVFQSFNPNKIIALVILTCRFEQYTRSILPYACTFEILQSRFYAASTVNIASDLRSSDLVPGSCLILCKCYARFDKHLHKCSELLSGIGKGDRNVYALTPSDDKT